MNIIHKIKKAILLFFPCCLSDFYHMWNMTSCLLLRSSLVVLRSLASVLSKLEMITKLVITCLTFGRLCLYSLMSFETFKMIYQLLTVFFLKHWPLYNVVFHKSNELYITFTFISHLPLYNIYLYITFTFIWH